MKNHLLFTAFALFLTPALAQRNLTTDEPKQLKGKPEGAVDYKPTVRPTDGQHLALTMKKLTEGIDPPRPFLIWALGSSYTNMLGNGEVWKKEIAGRFPKAPPVIYQKMVGNSCPWQYLRGWAKHLVVPDQPDLVLIYTIGKPSDLEKLIVELRTHTTADIIVPTIHWRERDQKLWGESENAADQDVGAIRDICKRHDVEFVESRKDWAAYLKDNELPISALLKDAVHQSDYGAHIINQNILAHLKTPASFSYTPQSREQIIQPKKMPDGSLEVTFVGTRIDLHGTHTNQEGKMQVWIDGKPANQCNAFLADYIQPGKNNSRLKFGRSPTVPRDAAPHGVTLGNNIDPQEWTITMTSDEGDYQLIGSVTGPDGRGNAKELFTSDSGQIVIEPDLWRRSERNRKGDTFTFFVSRTTMDEVNFRGNEGKRFVARIAQNLKNKEHKIRLVPSGECRLDALKVFRPPLTAEE